MPPGLRKPAAQEREESGCPLPPYRSSVHPPLRTALASHPRSGSTWLRFLLERSSGQACGFEDPGWANVLPHVGGVEGKPQMVNQERLSSAGGVPWCVGSEAATTMGTLLDVSTRSLRRMSTALSRFTIDLGHERSRARLVLPSWVSLTGGADVDAVVEALERGAGRVFGVTCQNIENKQPNPKPRYDRAVVLIRDPLDVFRSNYHYRTKVLGALKSGTWSRADHMFARERAQAYMNFYRGWRDFVEARRQESWLHDGMNPGGMLVYYERLKAQPAYEVQRILQFLQVEVSKEKLDCAVQQSTMDKLQEKGNDRGHDRVESKSFFGSRNTTEAQENLTYPLPLLRRFENMKLFEFATSMGYISYTSLEAAQDLAERQVPSEIQAPSMPWQEVKVEQELPDVPSPAELAEEPRPGQGLLSLQRMDAGAAGWLNERPMSLVQSGMFGLLMGILCLMILSRLWRARNAKQMHSETSPGPGRYSPSKSKGLQPSWGFGSGDREWNHLPHDYWPQTTGASPDLYSKQAPVKQRPRSFGRARPQEIPDTPGPGKVTLDIDVEHPRYPAYSLGGKNEFFWATYATPPSGGRMAQSIMVYKPADRSSPSTQCPWCFAADAARGDTWAAVSAIYSVRPAGRKLGQVSFPQNTARLDVQHERGMPRRRETTGVEGWDFQDGIWGW
eukprot:g18838.t1